METGNSANIVANNQAGDVNIWRAAFGEWLTPSKTFLKKKRLTWGDDDLVCGTPYLRR